MGLLESLPLIGRWFDKGLDLADQVIVDKDKMSELVAHLEDGKQLINKEIYIKELETKTLTWVDALHKMGRQILNLITIIAVCIMIATGHEFNQWTAFLIGGGNVSYQLIKGKGGK